MFVVFIISCLFPVESQNSGDFGGDSDDRLQPPDSMISVASVTSTTSQDADEDAVENKLVKNIKVRYLLDVVSTLMLISWA